MVFLPIYKYRYEPELNDLENYEQLVEVSKTGYLEDSFSLFDDLKIIVSQITSSEDSGLDIVVFFETGFFAMFQVLYGIIILCITVSSIMKTISLIQNGENSTMLMYNEMLKTGSSKKKENFFKKQAVITMILYAAFDIIFTKVFGLLFENFNVDCARNMVNFSGVSTSITVVIILLGCYIVSNAMRKKETEKMLIDITKSELDNK